jgi:hypothetical protein
MSAETSQPNRKTYASPSLNNLTAREAQLLIESQAAQSDKDAQDLLDLLS